MARRLVTKGEELFEFISTQVFTPPTTVDLGIAEFAKRSNHLLLFVDGVVLYHTLARVIRLGRAVLDRDDLESEPSRVAELKALLLDLMDIGASTCSDIEQLADLALAAARQVDKPINITTETEVLNEYRKALIDPQCYICGGELDRTEKQVLPEPLLAEILDEDLRKRVAERIQRKMNHKYLEFDHVWPNSLGGDSTAGNLLPICPFCNREKTDLVSWEWALVQSTVFAPVAHKPDILKKVPKHVKIALFMRAAFLYADQTGLSLKQAYQALGPKEKPRTLQDRDTSDFFNMEVHNGTKLTSLWGA